VEPATEQIAITLKSCPECAAQMPDFAAFCPGCGRSMQTQPEEATERPALTRDHVLGACAYCTFLPAFSFLLLDPYRRNPFVRFHSVQCLLFWSLTLVAAVLVRLLTTLLLLVPVVGPLLAVLCVTIAALAALFLWIVLVVKAMQGERFALPLIGGMAEKYSAVP
jgi:uncharacterized membrane protein